VPGGRQLRRGRVELAGIAAIEDDFGAVFGKALRKREPDALRRAGDERPLPVSSNSSNAISISPCWLQGQKLTARATS
jgi:hypothetical protein